MKNTDSLHLWSQWKAKYWENATEQRPKGKCGQNASFGRANSVDPLCCRPRLTSVDVPRPGRLFVAYYNSEHEHGQVAKQYFHIMFMGSRPRNAAGGIHGQMKLCWNPELSAMMFLMYASLENELFLKAVFHRLMIRPAVPASIFS